MQIDGAHLATAFAPKPSALQEQKRAPVTIDAIANFAVEAEPSSQKKTVYPRADQAVIRAEDSQQAQFIRFFSTTERSSADTTNQSSANSPQPVLPQSVQHYKQIDELSTEPSQTLVDETV